MSKWVKVPQSVFGEPVKDKQREAGADGLCRDVRLLTEAADDWWCLGLEGCTSLERRTKSVPSLLPALWPTNTHNGNVSAGITYLQPGQNSLYCTCTASTWVPECYLLSSKMMDYLWREAVSFPVSSLYCWTHPHRPTRLLWPESVKMNCFRSRAAYGTVL